MIGEKISELININNKIWHEATKIKTLDNSIKKEIPAQERVTVFFEIREHNKKRSKTRMEIDKFFNKEAPDESKINYGAENVS